MLSAGKQDTKRPAYESMNFGSSEGRIVNPHALPMYKVGAPSSAPVANPFYYQNLG
jgi:hypothetical protein